MHGMAEFADTKSNRLIIWGGGHGDYFGNEVYGLDLNNMTMSRLTEPSPVTMSPAVLKLMTTADPHPATLITAWRISRGSIRCSSLEAAKRIADS